MGGNIKRKVIKQGNNTLTITLPKDWTEKFNVKAGDEIDLEEADNGIIINTESHKIPKTISIDIDNLERLALAKLLFSCFEQGYDTITFNFSKSKISSWSHGSENITDVINFFVGRLIGFEVISQTSKSITIGNVSEKLTKFDNILSRIFFLIEEYLNHIVDALKTGDYTDLKEGENRHDNITKFVALASRIVSEDTAYTKTDAMNYFTVLHYMDKITDFIRYSYKNTVLFERKVSKSTITLAEETLRSFELYRHFFYKFDYKLITEIDELRGQIKKLYLENSKKGKESNITSNFDSIVEMINGILKSRVALELAKTNKNKIS